MTRLANSLGLRLGVTLSVLGYLLSQVDLGDATASVARIAPGAWGLIALALAADRALAATRWITLVWAAGIELPFRLGLRLFLVSSFLGSFLPAGVGGDIARTWQLSARTSQTREALVVAAADRWLGLTSVLILGALGLASWPGPISAAIPIAVHGLLAAVLVAGLMGAYADQFVGLLPRPWAEHRLAGNVTKMAGVVRALRLRWAAVGVAVVSSFAIQVVRVILAWLIGTGLGIDVPLSYYFVVMPVGIVLILLPISISGLGPAQGVIIWMLRPLGVPDPVSFAMSTLFILLGFVANLPGAVLYLQHRH